MRRPPCVSLSETLRSRVSKHEAKHSRAWQLTGTCDGQGRASHVTSPVCLVVRDTYVVCLEARGQAPGKARKKMESVTGAKTASCV